MILANRYVESPFKTGSTSDDIYQRMEVGMTHEQCVQAAKEAIGDREDAGAFSAMFFNLAIRGHLLVFKDEDHEGA